MPTNDKFYKYSFSGSDVSNVCWFSVLRDGELYTSPPLVLESLTTISISVHEGKSPVRSLGHRAVKGYTSSIRTIAGTIIGSVINNHPLKPLIDEYFHFKARYGPWAYSMDSDRDGSGYISGLNTKQLTHVFPTILPPFNLALNAITETAALQVTNPNGSIAIDRNIGRTVIPYTQLILFGIELIDDNTVISTNNPMTENAYTFVAQDYAVLHENLSGLGPELLFDAVNRESVIPLKLDVDRQAIWMEANNLKHKPGEASLEYIRDENGDITAITTHHDLPPELE